MVKVTKAGPNDKYGDVQASWDKHVEAFKETMRYAYTGDLHRTMHPEMASWAGPESDKHKQEDMAPPQPPTKKGFKQRPRGG